MPDAEQRKCDDAESQSPIHPSSFILSSFARTRRVWDNPVIWREIRTWAYGRKILVVRLAYLVLFALAAGSLYGTICRRPGGRARRRARWRWCRCCC